MSEGHRIRNFREREGLSLDGLADRIAASGIDRPSAAKLSRIETGQPVALDILPALSEITGIPAKELRPDLARLFDEAAR